MKSYDENFVPSFGEYLVENKLLDRTELNRALGAEKSSEERLDVVLTHLGLIDENVLYGSLAEYLEIRRFNPSMGPATPVFEKELSLNFIKSHDLIPISYNDKTLTLAVANPFDLDVFKSISYQVDLVIELVLATSTEIENLTLGIYDDLADENEPNLFEDETVVNQFDLQRLQEIANEAPVIQFVNQLITKAIDDKASDIHIEAKEDRVAVRFRLDGILKTEQEVSASMKDAIISRIKILSHLNIAEQRLPQDGRIKHNIRGREVDLRVSTTPTIMGESVVMRVLDRSYVDLNFNSLGMDALIEENYCELLKKPNGIILVTGPTGSGKTTTLYTSLEHLNHSENKIFTVEDPVEYQLKGINQVQVKPSIGLDFANSLRAILRQDPDIIMIGEIRDVETAKIAIQAALTGHLVFATLHTNSAASSITRLLDMGIEEYLLTSTIIGVLAQRLVRKACPNCASKMLENNPALNFHFKEGCEFCNHSGYKGRSMILELLVMEEALQKKISENKSAQEIENEAISLGMLTLKQQGLKMVNAGLTSFEEVMRVVGIE